MPMCLAYGQVEQYGLSAVPALQAQEELGLTLTSPEVFIPAMARCLFQLGLAKPIMKEE